MKSYFLFGKSIHLTATLLLSGMSILQLSAQQGDEEHPNLYTGASSAILPKDATEINLLNSVNSFWLAQNAYDGIIEATRIVNRVRYSRADHILRVSHGFSRSGRWDLGADLYYSRVRYDDEASSSPFRVYNNNYYEGDTTYSSISYFGIQVRAMPFANLPELTFRATYSFPVAGTDYKKYRINAQRPVLYVGALFSERLGSNLLGQLQGDFRTYFGNTQNERTLLVPTASGFLIFEIPGEHWYILSGLSFNLTFQESYKGGFLKANQQLYGSLGVIYRPNTILSLILSGQLPFIFDSGSSRSIWVRESYFGLNLGARLII
ncbi:MAG: hypothetical protein EPGJADBJ_05326 [Saprospiraceae bacterium]|nr:hypothetical protein [Saprospiraceae bacterium]